MQSNEAVVEDGCIEWELFSDKITFDNKCMNLKVGARMIGHNNNIEYYLTPLFPFKLCSLSHANTTIL